MKSPPRTGDHRLFLKQVQTLWLCSFGSMVGGSTSDWMVAFLKIGDKSQFFWVVNDTLPNIATTPSRKVLSFEVSTCFLLNHGPMDSFCRVLHRITTVTFVFASSGQVLNKESETDTCPKRGIQVIFQRSKLRKTIVLLISSLTHLAGFFVQAGSNE